MPCTLIETDAGSDPVAALLSSQDAVLTDAFKHGRDIHKETAEKVRSPACVFGPM